MGTKLTTDGLILRETPVGESDKFVTVLTRDRGVLRASARGARKVNSRSGVATRLLTHAGLSLQESKSGWYIDDARPLHVFFELKNDLEKLALAQYFCELAGVVGPREEPAEEALRLLLNALHYLTEGSRPPLLLKAIVEGRLLAGAGYAPALEACSRCGKTEGAFLFLPAEGRLLCADHGGNGLLLSPGALTGLRHLLEAPLERCFAFALPPEDTANLADAAEAFVLAQLGRGFNTLDFFKTVHS